MAGKFRTLIAGRVIHDVVVSYVQQPIRCTALNMYLRTHIVLYIFNCKIKKQNRKNNHATIGDR